MPELPEVEVSRLGITPHIEGKTITKIIVRNPNLRWLVPADVNKAEGLVLKRVVRRAKYLLLETDLGSIILHLGMTGKLRVIDKSVPVIKHDHFDIEFENGVVLRFNDSRRFGACLWQPKGEVHELLQKLGPEPLTEAFHDTHLFEQSRNKQVAIKNFIMDNHVVVGVGNIYANESLFKAGISPKRAAGKVSKQRYQSLTQYIKQTLQAAIKQGGTTLKDFVQSDGNPGYFAQELLVYGRGGQPCVQCGTKLDEVKIGQRTTVYCKQCQK
ncbi:bifunctional DNA-formamidopyrimidine glycosylase/DNA-(apurinic or apyrimidinic site) lyase [Psychrosphaera ytuae]|uniref:Formamidopyrimidine-DNA glycosylase n=1 Tax=Psychrosphaera ytuae TaxID=2820710 RepID=A0A975D8Z3_9GAMM|nr:bifunctional DNA-formamidopyrimidine glycosylase/DNA-(apurinic or apyrimidinic site) lyase [Psychrosphaera ytuae]QTH62702.1 bifunctional DNA-formamidopyrimidine glycosylase/DNA-(apurinic or apyrimidinic site) lyase [Psychrosphaera ytuae]